MARRITSRSKSVGFVNLKLHPECLELFVQYTALALLLVTSEKMSCEICRIQTG